MTRRRSLLVPLLVALAQSPTAATVRAEDADRGAGHHIVEDGETLSSIADRHYDNPHLWPALYRANRDQIKDPAHLYPGQSLLLPPISSTQRVGTSPRDDATGEAAGASPHRRP